MTYFVLFTCLSSQYNLFYNVLHRFKTNFSFFIFILVILVSNNISLYLFKVINFELILDDFV